MYETSWIDPIYYWFMMIMGMVVFVWYLYHFLSNPKQWDKWYVLFKSTCGLYIFIIFFLVWHPNLLNDPWLTRQCIRGVLFLGVTTWVLDAALRTYRRRLGC